MNRLAHGARIALRVDQRKIPFQDQVSVMFRRRLPADGEPPEQGIEFVGPRHVVIIFQHRKQQTFPETARPQEQQLTPRLFEQRQPARPVNVKIPFRDDLVKIANAVRKFHAMPLIQLIRSNARCNFASTSAASPRSCSLSIMFIATVGLMIASTVFPSFS